MVTQQPITPKLPLPSQQPNARGNVFIDASEHSLPDDSESSSNEAMQQTDDDRDVLIINETETLDDATKEPVPNPGQYGMPNTFVLHQMQVNLAP